MNDVKSRSSAAALKPATIITGATEGIGRAFADEFARDGHTLLLVARDPAKLAQAASELARDHSIEVRVTAQDLATVEGCDGVEQALRRFGLYADVLVNNAGIMSSGFFQDEDLNRVRRLIDLDVRAVVDLTLRFLPGMIGRGRGGVINISSMMGYLPVPYQATYAASKAFVLSFSKALAYETIGTGVRVSVVAPGVVTTALHQKAGAQNSRYLLWFPPWTPEEVARLAYRRFNRGWSVTMPGIVNKLGAFTLRFVPDFLLVPLMGWFFRVRDEEGRVLWPGGTLSAPTPKPKPAKQPARAESVD
jgi:short-subunit dehydrogenase